MTESVRVAFGLVLLHRCLDIAGFSLLASQPEALVKEMAIQALLAIGIAVGFATPLALLATLLCLSLFPVAEYLGLQVARILCWGLLLGGAGRSFSVDGLLSRRGSAARVFRLGYFLEARNDRETAELRFLLIALYWTVAFSGVRFHVFDAFWRKAEVLQLAMTLPYFSEHHAFFDQLSHNYPRAYDVLCSLGLYVQGFWQAMLLPLFYVPSRVVRAFAILQGLAFFVVSTFLLNLGYLGIFELCLWTLVFGAWPAFGLVGSLSRDPLSGSDADRGASRSCRSALIALALSAAFFFQAHSVIAVADGATGTTFGARLGASIHGMKIFGLGPVNVFNKEDLGLGDAHIVIAETDESGRPLRVVPFLDREGARLDYLRNDLLYFAWSLRWQRLPAAKKFRDGDPAQPAGATVRLVRGVAELDACLQGFDAPPRYYRAVVMTRQMIPAGRFLLWSPPQVASVISLVIPPARMNQVGARLAGIPDAIRCYDLPPGHTDSRSRQSATLAWLSDEVLKVQQPQSVAGRDGAPEGEEPGRD